jgi:glycosyl transferase family 25
VGEVGCILSHRSVYKRIAAEKIPLTLILEDDVHFAPDFPELLEQILQTQNKWDMVRFLDRKKIYRGTHRIIKQLSNNYAFTRVQAVPGGAYAYLITEQAARTLLRCTETNSVQIDITHGRVWETGLNVIAVKPSPVTPDMEIPSTIGDARFDKKLQIRGLTRFLFPFFRFQYKITTSFMIRLKYYQFKKQDQTDWN